MSEPVDQLESLDLGPIRAASRNAAWGSLVGGLIVVTAIVFSVLRMRTLDRDLALRATQIQVLEKSIEPLKQQQSLLQVHVREKQKELAALNAKLADAKQQEQLALAKKGALDRQLAVARDNKSAFEKLVSANFDGIMRSRIPGEHVDLLRVGVVPKASAKLLQSGTDGAKPWYAFSLWLDYRDEQVKAVADEELESVVYTFNHISLRKDEEKPQQTSTDKANGFRVGYVGWGATNNVVIELRLRGGKSARLDFDMHAVLPPELHVEVKGRRPEDPPAPRIPRPPAYRD